MKVAMPARETVVRLEPVSPVTWFCREIPLGWMSLFGKEHAILFEQSTVDHDGSIVWPKGSPYL